MKYRADIDGLRAIAVIAVILYHLNGLLPGGYIGVDIFFVISGFLVTAIVTGEIEAGNFSLREYFIRRIRRLFPILAIVVLVSVLFSALLFTPDDFVGLGESLIAQAVLLANFYFYGDSDYFSKTAETKPLLHLWSLAVEEQFYLFYPLFLLIVYKCKKNYRLFLLIAVIFLSIISSIYFIEERPKAVFYLLPFRMWEFCMGGAAYLLMESKTFYRYRKILPVVGLIGISLPMFLYDADTAFPGISALMPVLGISIYLIAGDKGNELITRLLSTKVLVFIGLMSYSLYLWHWPAIVFNNYWSEYNYFNNWELCLIILIISFVSWRFIENPIRNKRFLQSKRQLILIFVICNITFISLGYLIYKNEGFTSRFNSSVLKYLEAEKDRVGMKEFDTSLDEAERGLFKKISTGIDGDSIFILGDSHARCLVPILVDLRFDVYLGSLSSTPPILGVSQTSDRYFNAALKFIKAKNIKKIILVSKWTWSLEKEGDFKQLSRTLDALNKESVKVFILGQPPIYNFKVPRKLAYMAVSQDNRRHVEIAHTTTFSQYNTIQDKLFNESLTNNISFIDLRPIFINGKFLIISDDGNSLYYDNHHLSKSGAFYIKETFIKALLDR